MSTRVLAVALCFAVASVAYAGAIVSYRLTDGADGPVVTAPNAGGTWNGGESFVAEVWLTPTQDLAIRGMQVDHTSSSPELILGIDIDNVSNGIDGVPNFWFDYSPITIMSFQVGTYPASGLGTFGPTTGPYMDFSNLLQGIPPQPFPPASVYSEPFPGAQQLQLAADTPWRMGGMPVTLPMAEGMYTLDLLNEQNVLDDSFGMVIDFGFGMGPGDPVTRWGSASASGNVADAIVYAQGSGVLVFQVIPEPATLSLLAIGGMALLRRRKR